MISIFIYLLDFFIIPTLDFSGFGFFIYSEVLLFTFEIKDVPLLLSLFK